MSEQPSPSRSCPRCGSTDVHRSRSRGLEFVLRLMGVGFYRCVKCQSRFKGPGKWGKRQRRVMKALFWLLVIAVLIWAGMYLMGGGGMPPSQ
jgi:hypothetical protein